MASIMLFGTVAPKYDISRQDIRLLAAYQTFFANIIFSNSLASQYPEDFRTDCEKTFNRLSFLADKHKLNKVYMPFHLNMILDKLHLPNIAIPISHPISPVEYVTDALDEISRFRVAWGRIEETKNFWPDRSLSEEDLFNATNIKGADELYDEYIRALGK